MRTNHDPADSRTPFERFRDLTRRLLAVPKHVPTPRAKPAPRKGTKPQG